MNETTKNTSDQVAQPPPLIPQPANSGEQPLFLYIPVARLILLAIASCGLYEAYWIYRNWKFIKQRDGLTIRPFWRGIFGVFFCHSLLRRIHADTESRAIVEPSFSPGGLATGFVILAILANLIGRVPHPAAAVIAFVMPSYLFLVPVQSYVNTVHRSRSSTAAYYSWSGGHVLCLVLGLIFWGLAFIPLE